MLEDESDAPLAGGPVENILAVNIHRCFGVRVWRV
jgi:hypothetical protein